MGTFKDLTGAQFGKLRVLYRQTPKQLPVRWVCVCECGSVAVVLSSNLTSGKSSTCGCSRVVHGKWKTRAYASWRAMKYRCDDPTHPAYHNYGARGLRYCKRWESFDNFFADMGERPLRHTLERKNNKRGYSPSNCVWVSKKDNSRNRRTNRLSMADAATIRSDDRPQSEIAAAYGVSQSTISRVKRGVSWNSDE